MFGQLRILYVEMWIPIVGQVRLCSIKKLFYHLNLRCFWYRRPRLFEARLVAVVIQFDVHEPYDFVVLIRRKIDSLVFRIVPELFSYRFQGLASLCRGLLLVYIVIRGTLHVVPQLPDLRLTLEEFRSFYPLDFHPRHLLLTIKFLQRTLHLPSSFWHEHMLLWYHADAAPVEIFARPKGFEPSIFPVTGGCVKPGYTTAAFSIYSSNLFRFRSRNRPPEHLRYIK